MTTTTHGYIIINFRLKGKCEGKITNKKNWKVLFFFVCLICFQFIKGKKGVKIAIYFHAQKTFSVTRNLLNKKCYYTHLENWGGKNNNFIFSYTYYYVSHRTL